MQKYEPTADDYNKSLDITAGYAKSGEDLLLLAEVLALDGVLNSRRNLQRKY